MIQPTERQAASGYPGVTRDVWTGTLCWTLDNQPWRSEPVGQGVRRCPVDVDNDKARAELATR